MDRRTGIVVDVGETLKELSPTTIAVLLFTIDDTIDKQTEIANNLGCTSATVTNSLQSLEDLSIPLVVKRREYQITSEGEKVVGVLDHSIRRLGKDLCKIDWASDEDKSQLGELLKPLYNSRSLLPFFVLDSISQRIDVDGATQPITVADIVDDVKARRLDRGEAVTPRQVKRTLDRFVDTGSISIDGDDVVVEEKGAEQARLFNQLVEFCKEEEESGSEPNEPLTGQKRAFVPAYRVSSETSKDEMREIHLPFPPQVTLGDLSDQVQRMEREYGRDEILELNWTPAPGPKLGYVRD